MSKRKRTRGNVKMTEDNLLDEFNKKTNKIKEPVEVKDNEVYVNLKDIKVSYAQLGINSVMKFGKYKGLEVRKILARDPEYLQWLSGKYKFTEELLNAINGE